MSSKKMIPSMNKVAETLLTSTNDTNNTPFANMYRFTRHYKGLDKHYPAANPVHFVTNKSACQLASAPSAIKSYHRTFAS